MEHLGLVAPDSTGPAPSAGRDSDVSAAQWAALGAAIAALPAKRQKVQRAAQDLAKKASLCAREIAKAEEELAPHAPDAGGDFVERYCEAFQGEESIVALSVSAVHMATARATLAAEVGSAALATQFAPDGWSAQKEQMQEGRVLLQANPHSFACVLQFLRFRRLGIPGSGLMVRHPPCLPALLDRLGVPGMKPLLMPPEPTALAASAVLSHEQQAVVLSWLPPGARAELLFRASRDGFEAAAFHARCDDQGPTLVVALSAGGHRFGSFADQPWTSTGTWTACASAFLFRLGGLQGEQPARRSVKPGHQHGMYGRSDLGPLFGNGHGMNLLSGTGSCWCTFAPADAYNELVPGGGHLLAEAPGVTVTEYEVFRIIS